MPHGRLPIPSSLRTLGRGSQNAKLSSGQLTVGSWLFVSYGFLRSIAPGTVVASFDPLCEVQSDKASVEITSPFDGVVKEILVKEGEVAKVGSGLCLIETEEEDTIGESTSQYTSAPEPPPAASAPASPSKAPAKNRKPHPLDPNSPPVQSPRPVNADVLAPPSVRHFARQLDVDLALVRGSGKNGRIERADVEAFLAKPGAQAVDVSAPVEQGEELVVELARTRYGMWKAMTKSLEVPHFGYSTSLDITALHDLLPALNSSIPPRYLDPEAKVRQPYDGLVDPFAIYPPEIRESKQTQFQLPEGSHISKITYLPILVKMLSKAMAEWPIFRSQISSNPSASGKPTLTVRPTTDISLALSTPTGLYTPTINSVESLSVFDLASKIKHVSHLGRQVPCGLTPKEMPKRGGTITVSNIGAIGGEWAHPVLVPGGGVAIVALGRAKWVWDVERSEKGERRLKMGVSWSGDHRVVEGAELAAFVECWKSWVERPQRLLGEGV